MHTDEWNLVWADQIQIQIQIQNAFIQENTQTYVDQSWDWNPWGFICLIISWITITLRTF